MIWRNFKKWVGKTSQSRSLPFGNSKLYYYHATVLKIVDGDTIDLRVDVGFRIYTEHRFRLYLYNAPETRGPERAHGLIAKAHLKDLLPPGTELHVQTYKRDSFGRYLAWIYFDGECLNKQLVHWGYGVVWDGKGRRPSFDPEAQYPNTLS